MHIKNKPSAALPLNDALIVLESQNTVGTLDATSIGERWIIQLASLDLRTHPGFATLLFLGIDKDRGEAVYGDIKTLNLRTARKTPTEGGAVSAHLVIDLSSHPGLSGHRAVLEDVEGLSKTRILVYLRWLLDKFVTFTDTNAKGEIVNVTPNIADDVVLDKPIGQQLKDAKLIAVDVYRKARSSTIDKDVNFYEKSRAIEYRPVSRVGGSVATSIVTKILAKTSKAEYPEVRVRIEEPNGSERSVGVNREKTDALLGAFQLRTLVSNLNPPLDEATTKITKHLVAEMKKALPKLGK